MASVARRIMLAVDGSKYSDYTFEWYVKYFYREGDTLILLYCAENGALLTTPLPMGDPTTISKLANEEEVEVVKLMKSYQTMLNEAKQIHNNLKGFLQRISGRKAGEMIAQQAEEQRVDMVLAGARGRSQMRRTPLGSVSEYLANHARVPLLLVKPTEEMGI